MIKKEQLELADDVCHIYSNVQEWLYELNDALNIEFLEFDLSREAIIELNSFTAQDLGFGYQTIDLRPSTYSKWYYGLSKLRGNLINLTNSLVKMELSLELESNILLERVNDLIVLVKQFIELE